MCRPSERWTPEEDQIALRLCKKSTPAAIAKELGRAQGTVQRALDKALREQRIKRYRTVPKHAWLPAEERYLRTDFQTFDHTLEDAVEHLQEISGHTRTLDSIRLKLHELGIRAPVTSKIGDSLLLNEIGQIMGLASGTRRRYTNFWIRKGWLRPRYLPVAPGRSEREWRVVDEGAFKEFLVNHPHAYDRSLMPDVVFGRVNRWKQWAKQRADPTAGLLSTKQAADYLQRHGYNVTWGHLFHWIQDGRVRTRHIDLPEFSDKEHFLTEEELKRVIERLRRRGKGWILPAENRSLVPRTTVGRKT